MIEKAIDMVVNGESLTAGQAEMTMAEIMAGECTPAQIGGLLVGLRMKGETPVEVAGFARSMRDSCLTVRTTREDVVDTCGKGGDSCDTFNISTCAALVAAGAGVPIAKHGNRSVSSQCGSADVLKELGLNMDMTAEQVGWSIDDVGIGFLFAPNLHPAMGYAIGPRREMAIRTVFNILGPLTNPAGAKRQIIGVFSREMVPLVAGALRELGCERGLVVHGLDGMDEISTMGPTLVQEVNCGVDGDVEWTLDTFGLDQATPEDLAGGEPAEMAEQLVSILEGETGPKRDIVVVNAAAAIYVGGKADSVSDGFDLAEKSIDDGAARRTLRKMISFSNGE